MASRAAKPPLAVPETAPKPVLPSYVVEAWPVDRLKPYDQRASASRRADRAAARVKARYAGKVPCAVLDVTRDKAMILTIRMNRAKGCNIYFAVDVKKSSTWLVVAALSPTR